MLSVDENRFLQNTSSEAELRSDWIDYVWFDFFLSFVLEFACYFITYVEVGPLRYSVDMI